MRSDLDFPVLWYGALFLTMFAVLVFCALLPFVVCLIVLGVGRVFDSYIAYWVWVMGLFK